jgi:tetratricopeptide (TPR) repeat protein
MGLEKTITDALDRTNLRMTDLGLSVSQMVHDAMQPDIADDSGSDSDTQHDSDDDEEYLESALLLARKKSSSRKSRNRTGARGRPRGIDYGFGRSTTHKMAPEAARLMGTANLAFVSRDHARALSLLLQVIQLSPHSFEPYHTTGLVYEECGERDKAAGFYMLAALVNPTNRELWVKLAGWAEGDERAGKREEAVFCLGKAISAVEMDSATTDWQGLEELYWRRARLLLCQSGGGGGREAVKSFTRLLSFRVSDIALVKRVAKLAIAQGIPAVAAQVLERASVKCPNPSDLSWSVVNLILELLFMSGDDAGEAVRVCQKYSRSLVDQSVLLSNPEWGLWSEEERDWFLLEQMPVEVYLKYLIAVLQTDPDLLDGRHFMNRVIARCDPETYGDLLTVLADTLVQSPYPQEALQCLHLLQSNESTWSTRSCCLLGHTLAKLSRHKEAVEAYRTCLAADPGCEEARVALAACYKQLGDDRRVLETLESGRRYRRTVASSGSSGSGGRVQTEGHQNKDHDGLDKDDNVWSGSSSSGGGGSSGSDTDTDTHQTNTGSLLMPKVTTAKKRTKKRLRHPTPKHHYTDQECRHSKQEHTRILLALQVGPARRELYSDALLAARQLIQDGLLSNPNVMVTSTKRLKWLESLKGDERLVGYLKGLGW